MNRFIHKFGYPELVIEIYRAAHNAIGFSFAAKSDVGFHRNPVVEIVLRYVDWRTGPGHQEPFTMTLE